MHRSFRVGLASLAALSLLTSALVVIAVAPAVRFALPAAAAIARTWLGVAHATPALHRVVPGLPDASLCSSAAAEPAADRDFDWALRSEQGSDIQNDGGSAVSDALDRESGPAFCFTSDGAVWVVRDRALIERASELLAPVRDIGRQMGEVGREMGAEGRRLGEWGRQYGRLAGQLAGLQVRVAMARLNDQDTEPVHREIAKLRAELDRLRDEQPTRIDPDRSAELRSRMHELSQREREAVHEARLKLRELGEEARRAGKALKLGPAGSRAGAPGESI